MSEGISVRFREKWEVVCSLASACSVNLCPDCGQFFVGHGESLRESMAEADAKLTAHVCPALQQRAGDEPV